MAPRRRLVLSVHVAEPDGSLLAEVVVGPLGLPQGGPEARGRCRRGCAGRRRARPSDSAEVGGNAGRRSGRAGRGIVTSTGRLREKSPRKFVLSGYLLQGGAPLPPSPPLPWRGCRAPPAPSYRGGCSWRMSNCDGVGRTPLAEAVEERGEEGGARRRPRPRCSGPPELEEGRPPASASMMGGTTGRVVRQLRRYPRARPMTAERTSSRARA